ncbi:MAG: hypothetical protein HY815_28715 [Candidatus Riflebacteria bacterium]|nr:hypothetical protein [Candidatus Riflebacteria bacterium]
MNKLSRNSQTREISPGNSSLLERRATILSPNLQPALVPGVLQRLSGVARTLSTARDEQELVMAAARLVRRETRSILSVVVAEGVEGLVTHCDSSLEGGIDLPEPGVLHELVDGASSASPLEVPPGAVDHLTRLGLGSGVALHLAPSIARCAILVGSNTMLLSRETIVVLKSIAMQLALVLRSRRAAPSGEDGQPAGCWSLAVIDAAGELQYVTRTIQQVARMQRSGVLDLTPLLVDRRLEGTSSHRRLWEAIHGDGVFEAALVTRDDDGGCHGVRTTVAAVKEEDGSIHHLVGHYRALSRSRSRSRHTAPATEPEGHRSLDALAMVAVHHLKDPLRSIETVARFLLQYVSISTSLGHVEAVGGILGAVHQIRSELHRLLTLVPTSTSRIPVEPVDLEALLGQLQAQLIPGFWRRSARLGCGALPSVRANPVLMRILLENMIYVALHREEARRSDLAITTLDEGAPSSTTACFSVHTVGRPTAPIDSDGHASLIDPWRHEVVRLNLELAKTVIRLHGGNLWEGVTADGAYSIFFALPRASPPPAAAIAPDGPAPVGSPGASAGAGAGPSARSTAGPVPATAALLGYGVRRLLSSIDSAVESLSRSSGQAMPKTLRAAVAHIRKSCTAMHDLIDNLMDTIYLDGGAIQLVRRWTDLNTLVFVAADGVRSMAGERSISLAVQPSHERAAARVDAPRLHGVLQRLLSNAIRFTQAGGRVEIGVRVESGTAVIWVEDNGQGIPDLELPRLFSRLSGTSVRPIAGEPGAGLGLNVASRIVQLHGGALSVEAQEGSGTRLEIAVPVGSD